MRERMREEVKRGERERGGGREGGAIGEREMVGKRGEGERRDGDMWVNYYRCMSHMYMCVVKVRYHLCDHYKST